MLNSYLEWYDGTADEDPDRNRIDNQAGGMTFDNAVISPPAEIRWTPLTWHFTAKGWAELTSRYSLPKKV